MQTNATIDIAVFLHGVIAEINSDIENALGNGFNGDAAWRSLTRIQGKTEALAAFLDAATFTPTVTTGPITLTKETE